jgi:hypothetical protein
MLLFPTSENDLKEEYKSSRDTFNKLAKNYHRDPITLSKKWRHPLAMGCVKKAKWGQLSSDAAVGLMNDINNVSSSIISTIEAGEIAYDQSMHPHLHDNNRSLNLKQGDRDIDSSYSIFSNHLQTLNTLLGEAWVNYIRPISTITWVTVDTGHRIPFYSGSTNEWFGAIVSAIPSESWITAEILTHEAAHMWLSLEEEKEELVDEAWEHDCHYSPWREDSRPPAGIMHGLFVFTSVAEMYVQMAKSEPPSNERDRRLALLNEQLIRAIQVSQAFNGFSNSAIAICDMASNMLDDRLHIPSEASRLWASERAQSDFEKWSHINNKKV